MSLGAVILGGLHSMNDEEWAADFASAADVPWMEGVLAEWRGTGARGLPSPKRTDVGRPRSSAGEPG